MDDPTCPACGTAMEPRRIGAAEVAACPQGHGVFLPRPELGALVEAEQDWHKHAGQHTAPLPRITADMTSPPAPVRPAQAWVETLFG